MKTLLIHIQGKVQGVGFRYHTQQKAKELGLVGLVTNNPDGSVSTLAQGREAALSAFLIWCHSGPPSSVVESAVATEAQFPPLTAFEIRR